jgi:ubiquinone/menaquinone biosynthesis C-methylase UbiE
MDAFYRVARQDYRLLAQEVDWHELLDGRNTLLDVACGSGKFPEALDLYADLAPAPPISYALLDPSPFSLAEAQRALRPPFVAAAEYQCPLQELDPQAGPFDVVWSIHGLYALPSAELDAGIEAFLGALAPGGLGVIAHASSDAHYLHFYRLFLEDFRRGDGTPYTSSEEILAALERAGASCETRRLDYLAELGFDDRETLEGYLQRCAFDDTVSLVEMERAPRIGRYIGDCRDEATDRWRFAQHVELMLIRAPARAGYPK